MSAGGRPGACRAMRGTARRKARLVPAALVAVLVMACAPPAGAAAAGEPSTTSAASGLFYDGFESRNDGWHCSVDSLYDRSFAACRAAEEAHRLRRGTPSVPRNGQAMRFRVPPNGEPFGSAPHPYRSELAQRNGTAETAGLAMAPLGRDSWYGFSVNVNSHVAHADSGTILAQWHKLSSDAQRDNRPPVALWVFEPEGQPAEWRLRLSPGDGSTRTWRGPAVRLGAWSDWVFHMRWSCDSPDGVIEAWLDGEKVFDTRVQSPGLVCSGLSQGPYFKIGLYHPSWASVPADQRIDDSELVLYADEVRVRLGGGSRREVAPP